MNKELLKISKCLSGNVLGIGLKDDKLVDSLYNNDLILDLTLLDPYKKNNKKLSLKKSSTKKMKSINIKKIKKKFKHKKVDFIICNNEDIKKYYRTFIRDSVYINKKILYIYGNKNDIDIEDIMNKYKRYDVKIELINFKDSFIIKIDNSNSDNIWLRDKLYYIYDTLVYIRDIIADGLTS